MSVTEEKPRHDLAALKIHRDEEHEPRSFPLVRIAVWLVVLAVLAVGGYAGYQKFVVPRSAPAIETIVVKPSVNVAHPGLLSATGYLVADIGSTLAVKLEAVKCYATQFPAAKAGIFGAIETMNRYHGLTAGLEAGELFLTYRSVGVDDLMRWASGC